MLNASLGLNPALVGLWGGVGEKTINMPISTEGSGMPTTRPKDRLSGLRYRGRRNRKSYRPLFNIVLPVLQNYPEYALRPAFAALMATLPTHRLVGTDSRLFSDREIFSKNSKRRDTITTMSSRICNLTLF